MGSSRSASPLDRQAARSGCRRVPEDAALKIEVRLIFDQNFSVYGVR